MSGSSDEGQTPRPDDSATSDNAAPATARPKRAKHARKSRLAGFLTGAGKTIVALISIIAIGATGFAYVAYDRVQRDIPTAGNVLDYGDSGDESQAPTEDDGADDILLVGNDARTDMQGNPLPEKMLKLLRTEDKGGINTDTIILLRIPKNGAKPTGISIPRDTWVSLPEGGGQSKINAVFGLTKMAAADAQRNGGERDRAKVERDSDKAGRRTLVQTVQELTQVRVDHYAEANLLGFYLLTEALGGVQVCLKQATEDKDSGADFRAGQQVVSGGAALSFVRQRKNLPHGDLDRIIRQQVFLSSALKQILSAGTLTDPSKLAALTDAIHRSIVLDDELDILEFAQQTRQIASGEVEFTTIPVTTMDGRSPDGQSIVEVDPEVVREFARQVVGRTPTSAPPTGGGSGSGSALSTQVVVGNAPCVN